MIRVQVCGYCGATRAIVAIVKEAEQTYPGKLDVEYPQCLNECHNLPVVKVNGRIVPDATPPLVLRAIERALQRELSKG